MSNLSLFLKKNKKVKENVKFPATKSLCDEKGNVKYYYRYMDDIVILGSDKKELHKLLLEIKDCISWKQQSVPC